MSPSTDRLLTIAALLFLGCPAEKQQPPPAPHPPALAPAPAPAPKPIVDAGASAAAAPADSGGGALAAGPGKTAAPPKPTTDPAAPKPAAEPAAPKPAAEPAAPKADPKLPENGAAVFASKCKTCHGADGSKAMIMKKKVRPLNGADFQRKTSDAQLATAIKDGMGEPNAAGKKPMPAFGEKLTDDDIQAVVAYLRTLK